MVTVPDSWDNMQTDIITGGQTLIISGIVVAEKPYLM